MAVISNDEREAVDFSARKRERGESTKGADANLGPAALLARSSCSFRAFASFAPSRKEIFFSFFRTIDSS
jgi:hypothetical protein